VQLADSGVGCTASVGCGALSLWLLWLEVVWEGGTVYRNGACFCGCLSGLEHLLADSGQDARRVRLRLGVRMYVCVYIHTYIRMYVCTYVRMYVHTYIHTYVRVYVRMYVCTYVCMYGGRGSGGSRGMSPRRWGIAGVLGLNGRFACW
jgi:hypothetical protein